MCNSVGVWFKGQDMRMLVSLAHLKQARTLKCTVAGRGSVEFEGCGLRHKFSLA